MRILLATEGPSDEIVAESLIAKLHRDVTIDRKRFPARGFSVVERLISVFVRAGHFGHFEVLIVHFDLDDTLPQNFTVLSESKRWTEIHKRVDDMLTTLPNVARAAPLAVVLMTPCRSTEAWLAWGRGDATGRKCEQMDRHNLKRSLFGDPPRRFAEKSHLLVRAMLNRMDTDDDWPLTLRLFVDELKRIRNIADEL